MSVPTSPQRGRTVVPLGDQLEALRRQLVVELAEHALLKGDFVLSSGARAEYLVDAKRVTLSASGFALLRELLPAYINAWDASAVGGLTLGADAISYAAVASGAVQKIFIVRKEAKPHGLAQQVEGPALVPGEDRCLIVDDVVTTGASTIKAIRAAQALELEICGVLSIVDRQAGGDKAIEGVAGAPYSSLTLIDEIYPGRPDR